MNHPNHNLPVIATVGDDSSYEPAGSQHVVFYEDGRWHYQDTAEHFKAEIAQWREASMEEWYL